LGICVGLCANAQSSFAPAAWGDWQTWSLDGEEWHETGATYRLEWGNYRGDRLGLYTYGNHGEGGEATFTDFRYVSADKATAVHPH